MKNQMSNRLVIVALSIVALTGCEPSELYPVPAVPIGGGNGGYTAPAKPISPANQVPMLQDPEGNLSDESATIYAKSLDAALIECQKTANSLSDQQTIVTCLGCKLMTSAKSGRYSCTYRTERR